MVKMDRKGETCTLDTSEALASPFCALPLLQMVHSVVICPRFIRALSKFD